MSRIAEAIERSSLGTKTAQAKRRTVPPARARRIVAVAMMQSSSKKVGGKRT
jgi:hypothetical protein